MPINVTTFREPGILATGYRCQDRERETGFVSTKWLKGSEWELFAKNGHKWGKYVNATHSAVEVHLFSLPCYINTEEGNKQPY